MQLLAGIAVIDFSSLRRRVRSGFPVFEPSPGALQCDIRGVWAGRADPACTSGDRRGASGATACPLLLLLWDGAGRHLS